MMKRHTFMTIILSLALIVVLLMPVSTVWADQQGNSPIPVEERIQKLEEKVQKLESTMKNLGSLLMEFADELALINVKVGKLEEKTK
jgi:uncharacterized coiled-coil protein SlyX